MRSRFRSISSYSFMAISLVVLTMPPGHWPPTMTFSCNCAKFAPNMPNARLSLNVSSALGAMISPAYQPTSAGQPQSEHRGA